MLTELPYFVNSCGAPCVDVLRFCHHLIVQGKCHHEGDGDIEQEGTDEVDSVESSGDGQYECWESS